MFGDCKKWPDTVTDSWEVVGVEVQIYYYWVCFVLYPLTKNKDQTRFRREVTFGGLEFCH